MGHHSCCNKQKVKKGLWSPEEDEKLVNYISMNGHGCWSTVPRRAGLQRCGKSCRLRWINYLRPDLKRGSFSPQEASVIIELHRVLGNRWAQIAMHLPGRTDNEVKNFWNSTIKKKIVSHHGLSDLPNFPPNLSNTFGTGASLESTLSVNANPNLIPSAQFDNLCIPTTAVQGFDHNSHSTIIKVDEMNNFPNVVPVPVLTSSVIDSSISSSYDLVWPVGNLQSDNHHLNHPHVSASSFYASNVQLVRPKMITQSYDDDDDKTLMGHGTPKFCEILKGSDQFSLPSLCTRIISQEVDPMAASISSFCPSALYPCDQIVPGNRLMESIESLMSTMPSSSSSSSSLSPAVSCSQLLINSSLPSGWGP